MRVVVAVLAFASVAVTAQPSDGPPVTVGAVVSYQPVVGGFAGGDLTAEVSAFVLALDGSARIVRRSVSDVRVGTTLRLASTGFLDTDSPYGRALTFQNVELYATAATTTQAGAHVEGTVGVVVDLGPDLFDADPDGDGFFNSDTQHALRLGARVAQPVGPLTLRAGVDGFATLLRRVTLPFTSLEVPASADSTYQLRIDYGDTVNAHVGASQRVGPVELGLTLLYSGRSDSRFESVGLTPEQREPSGRTLSVVPSVTYRAPSGVVVELAARASGVWPGEHAVTGIPLVVRDARVPRLPLSLRVGYLM